VDLVAQVLVVRLSRSRGETSTPKSGHEREIPICAPLYKLLEGGGTGLVVTAKDGSPLDEKALLRAVRRACKRAGLDPWRFHDLRHYFVTQLFRSGGSAPAVQLLAGHADLATTQRYAHMARQDLRATVALLG
jgi:site-specific recombinase XerD